MTDKGVAAKTRKTNRDKLSETELETLRLIAEGKTNAEIGRLMYVVEDTVKSRVARLLVLLEVDTRTALVHVAHMRHLIGHPDPVELTKQIEQLKRTNAGQRAKNQELSRKVAELISQVSQLEEQAARLRHANQELGRMANSWLDSTQGQL